jgi:hypothetical protein
VRPELFAPTVLYRERKYQQLATDNQGRAQRRVLDLLQTAGKVTMPIGSTTASHTFARWAQSWQL